MKSKHMELLGLSVFCVSTFLYSSTLGNEVMNYIQGNSLQHSIYGLILVASLVFNFVSVILLIITIRTIQSKFSSKGMELNLSDETRKLMDDIKNIFIAVIVFIFITSFNIYFSSIKLGTMIKEAMEASFGNPYFSWVDLTLGVIVFALSCVLMDNINKNYPNSDDLKSFIYNYTVLFVGILGLFFITWILPLLFVLLNQLFPTSKMFLLPKSGFGIDIIFDMLKWIFTILTIVYLCYTFIAYSGLDITAYRHIHFKEYVLTILTFMIVLITSQLSRLKWFADFLMIVVKYLLPLALLGLSSYLVFATDKISKLAKKDIIE